MPDENGQTERFVLREKGGWFQIEQQPWDDDFRAYIDAGVVVGKFRSREDARTFMVGYMHERRAAASSEESSS